MRGEAHGMRPTEMCRLRLRLWAALLCCQHAEQVREVGLRVYFTWF